MKLWKAFALASLVFNIGIVTAVGWFWWRSNDTWEHQAWFDELALSDEEADRMFEIVDERHLIADEFFAGLDEDVDVLIQALEGNNPDREAIMAAYLDVEEERRTIAIELFEDLIDFLLDLDPDQRVEALFFMFEAEDLALWFF